MTVSFADLGVPNSIVNALAANGIEHPFPIQAATIPDALAGRDLCGRAPTGSGKTIAFGIPLVAAGMGAPPHRPRGLVLVPTRELAAQVTRELDQLAGRPGPRTLAVYGGAGFDVQIRNLRRGVDIVVACPGRLTDLVEQGQVDLGYVTMVVIDEADRLADMGFMPAVRKLLDLTPDDRQTLLFSATLDGDVDELIRRYQQDPVRHEHVPDDDDGGSVEHHFWKVERNDRLALTAKVVKRSGPSVVFTRTKHGADRIARQLSAAGVAATAIHGNRSQAQRERALASFHKGEVLALVATDVAARGIHVDGVTCVVHFDPPGDPKDYVHRSGRTARAGATGVVVSMVMPELRKDVGKLQKELGHPVGLTAPDVELLPGWHGEAPEVRRPDKASAPERSRAGAGGSRSARRRDKDNWEPRASAGARKPRRSGPRISGGPGGRQGGPNATRSRAAEGEPGRVAAGRGGKRRGADADRARVGGAKPAGGARVGGAESAGGARVCGGKSGGDGRVGGGKSGGDARVGGGKSGGERERFDERPPLAEGQRRPSGAARRKAKKAAGWTPPRSPKSAKSRSRSGR